MQTLLKILAEKVARGNAVQIHPNFPAKSLSICTKNFSGHLFNLMNYCLGEFETNKMIYHNIYCVVYCERK